MAYFITEACISCGTCESECPVSCISAGDSVYVIDADACIECGACKRLSCRCSTASIIGLYKGPNRYILCILYLALFCGISRSEMTKSERARRP